MHLCGYEHCFHHHLEDDLCGIHIVDVDSHKGKEAAGMAKSIDSGKKLEDSRKTWGAR